MEKFRKISPFLKKYEKGSQNEPIRENLLILRKNNSFEDSHNFLQIFASVADTLHTFSTIALLVCIPFYMDSVITLCIKSKVFNCLKTQKVMKSSNRLPYMHENMETSSHSPPPLQSEFLNSPLFWGYSS